MFQLDDSDDEEEEERDESPPQKVQEPVVEDKPEKKKKKKKKSKQKKDDEEDFLDEIVAKTQQEKSNLQSEGFTTKEHKGVTISSEPSLLYMERKYFSYRREMKALFAESAAQFGALGLDEEEKKGNNLDEQIEA